MPQSQQWQQPQDVLPKPPPIQTPSVCSILVTTTIAPMKTPGHPLRRPPAPGSLRCLEKIGDNPILASQVIELVPGSPIPDPGHQVSPQHQHQLQKYIRSSSTTTITCMVTNASVSPWASPHQSSQVPAAPLHATQQEVIQLEGDIHFNLISPWSDSSFNCPIMMSK